MTLKSFLFAVAVGLVSASPALSATINVFKDPGCGCCGGWIAHMRSNGFSVSAMDVTPEQMDLVKAKAGIGSGTASCHTAFIDGYVIEGHVPAADVARLLSERPDAIGLSVPGMPAGSPGMEAAMPEAYDVLLIHRDGRADVFASH